ncbi:MAG: RimK family alpha-L-glutamate ligase [Lewinellaceae bacterium]|nr:RimK family alpha-L-glutamate ligase [Lewinellaceae bacterium]
MNIVILSRNTSLYSTDSLVRACRLRNHHVRVIDHMYCDLLIENGKSKVYFNNQEIAHVDAIIPRIGSSATTHGASVIRQFESKGVITTLNSTGLLMARDKLSCLQILENHQIPVPKTIYISNSLSIEYLLRQMEEFPTVIKLVSGTQGLGVILAENYKNAESIIEAFYATREKVILQKFIKEAQGADLRAFVVDGRIVASMKRQAKEGEFRSNLHRGASANTILLTEREAEVAISAVKALQLSVAGVDMLQTLHGPVVLEVNASPGLEGIETVTGANVSGEIVRFLESRWAKK